MADNRLQRAAEIAETIAASIRTVIIGNDDEVKMGVAALFSEGHILIEGVPGVGKTMFARSMAKSIGLSFKRIQCTDLLPATYCPRDHHRRLHLRPEHPGVQLSPPGP